MYIGSVRNPDIVDTTSTEVVGRPTIALLNPPLSMLLLLVRIVLEVMPIAGIR